MTLTRAAFFAEIARTGHFTLQYAEDVLESERAERLGMRLRQDSDNERA